MKERRPFKARYDACVCEYFLDGPGVVEITRLPMSPPGSPQRTHEYVVKLINDAYEIGMSSREHSCCECSDLISSDRPCRYCAGLDA